jgi:hypothetical protein
VQDARGTEGEGWKEIQSSNIGEGTRLLRLCDSTAIPLAPSLVDPFDHVTYPGVLWPIPVSYLRPPGRLVSKPPRMVDR